MTGSLREPGSGNEHFNVVIVGGGLSAGYACMEFVDRIREKDKISIALLSKESIPPYDKNALASSNFLRPLNGRIRSRVSELLVKPEKWYASNGIELFLNAKVTRIEYTRKIIHSKGKGSSSQLKISYDTLLFAMCAEPDLTVYKKLNCSRYRNIFTTMNLRSSSLLLQCLNQSNLNSRNNSNPLNVLIVDDGTKRTMQLAAALQQWDAKCPKFDVSKKERRLKRFQLTIVSETSHLMPELFTEELSTWFENRFQQEFETRFIMNTSIECFCGGESANASYAQLSNGDREYFGVCILGNETYIDDKTLLNSQLRMAKFPMNGIKVNRYLETSIADVYAVGDYAAFTDISTQKRVRLELESNAIKSASLAVNNIILKNEGRRQLGYDYIPQIDSVIFSREELGISYRFYGSYSRSGLDLDRTSIVHFGDLDSILPTPFGAFWVDENNTICAGIVCNGNEKVYAELKELIDCKQILSLLNSKGARSMYESLKQNNLTSYQQAMLCYTNV